MAPRAAHHQQKDYWEPGGMTTTIEQAATTEPRTSAKPGWLTPRMMRAMPYLG
jgi:hypothetical protein